MSSSCPFCHLHVPLPDLERHANNHLVEDELARDMELAQQIALAPTSPPRVTDKQVNYPKSFKVFARDSQETGTSRFNGNSNDYIDRHDQEKIACLVHLQIRSTFYKVEGGLMALLAKCLESESETSVSIICGYVDHFQSIDSEDSGWGCGWRNIQMLSSHLLKERQEAKEVMFGGSGYVPDIPSLQGWLEIAWERGFDILGSGAFNHKIYGSTKWIGTTECATLFRSFGLRAKIVDFGCKENVTVSLSVWDGNAGAKGMQKNNGGKRKMKQVYGPMDKFLLSRDSGVFQVDPIRHEKSGQANVHSCDDLPTFVHRGSHTSIGHEKNKISTSKIKGHQVLFDWVWNYFTDKGFNHSSNLQRVIVSEKTPLYFQHDGHSRTIVGIQLQKRAHNMPEKYSLLIIDPAQSTAGLGRSLRANVGWQKLIKRGVHTLKKRQYQLCYVDPGVAIGEEMEQLKNIDSSFFEF